jgi:signal transduction histidine kinase
METFVGFKEGAMDDTPDSHALFLFLASTAHDMKNSISVLSGTLETLLAGASPQTESAYARMAHMLYQTKRLNDSLMQLLALYKQVGKPGYPFDIRALEVGQLVDQVVAAGRILLKSRGLTLDVVGEPELIWHCDEDLIIGVVGHAINNAIHYTHDRIRLATAVVDDCLEIRVEDNGPGYPEAMLAAGAHAMNGSASGVNFLSNSAGLGLYFSREVARMHKHRGRCGTVRLENGGALGGGCFVLSLP